MPPANGFIRAGGRLVNYRHRPLGTSPRQRGYSPRQMGKSPRQQRENLRELGQSPRQLAKAMPAAAPASPAAVEGLKPYSAAYLTNWANRLLWISAAERRGALHRFVKVDPAIFSPDGPIKNIRNPWKEIRAEDCRRDKAEIAKILSDIRAKLDTDRREEIVARWKK